MPSRSFRKSRKAKALLAELVPRVHRRSARLVQLEQRKRAEAAARAAAAAVAQEAGQPAAGGGQVTTQKRGRKRKHVDELTGGRHGSGWQAGPPLVGSSSGGFLTSTPAPGRKALESALDLLQMTDPDGLLAMPKNIQEGTLDDSISSPRDFGTVRTKLHDGFYVTLEHFESDVFSVTSKAKRPDQPETQVHKLAKTVEETAVTVFGALRDQPDFEAQLLKWAANNRKTTGQLRIGGSGAAATGGASSTHWPGAGAGPDGNASGTPSRGVRPGAAGGRRRHRKGGGGRSGGTARRPRRKTCEVPDVYSRDDSLQQYGQPERRWTYMPDSNDDPICNMVFRGSQLPLGELKVGKEISYEESLMRFARHGGPIAEKIARKMMEEQRAAITEKMERTNLLAAVPGDAQWKLPAASNSNVVYTAPTAGMPTNGQLASLFDRQGGLQGSSSPAIGELTALGGLGSSPPLSNIAESPCVTSGISYPPPSIIASSTGGISGNGGASYPNWPTSAVGSSSGATAAYRLYTNAVNLPAPDSVLEDQRASAWRGVLQGEGSFAGCTALGRPGIPNYARHFSGFTSAASTYQPSPAPPAAVPQPNMVEFLRFGRGINVGNTAPGRQLPVQQVDGFQYLLSVDDGQLAAGRGRLGGDLCGGNMAAPGAVSASRDLSSEWKAAIPVPQPELIRRPAPSQAVFDLKLLQSRLGENPWGKNGISALKPWNFPGVNSSNMELAGSSNQASAELSTLNLLGGRSGDFNLNL